MIFVQFSCVQADRHHSWHGVCVLISSKLKTPKPISSFLSLSEWRSAYFATFSHIVLALTATLLCLNFIISKPNMTWASNGAWELYFFFRHPTCFTSSTFYKVSVNMLGHKSGEGVSALGSVDPSRCSCLTAWPGL